jgi:hypothetical protein
VDAVEKQDRLGRPRLNVRDEPMKFFGDLGDLSGPPSASEVIRPDEESDRPGLADGGVETTPDSAHRVIPNASVHA